MDYKSQTFTGLFRESFISQYFPWYVVGRLNQPTGTGDGGNANGPGNGGRAGDIGSYNTSLTTNGPTTVHVGSSSRETEYVILACAGSLSLNSIQACSPAA